MKDHRPSTIDHRPSTIDHRPSTIDHRPSTIDHRPSTIDHRPSTIDHRPSTILKIVSLLFLGASFYASKFSKEQNPIRNEQPLERRSTFISRQKQSSGRLEKNQKIIVSKLFLEAENPQFLGSASGGVFPHTAYYLPIVIKKPNTFQGKT